MKSEIFLQKSSNLFAQNRLLKFAVLVIAAVVLYNTWMIRKALNTHRTILVPPVINQQIEFQGEKASESYIRQMVRYAMTLAVNNSPLTAEKQFQELLTLYAPESYPAAYDNLIKLASKIKDTAMSSAFYADTILLDEQNQKVEVKGIKIQFIKDVLTGTRQTAYEIAYRIQEGRFMIISIKEMVDDKQ
jgi:conjugal transfer pilus assembly protein TraE